jgi:hypothetical protein
MDQIILRLTPPYSQFIEEVFEGEGYWTFMVDGGTCPHGFSKFRPNNQRVGSSHRYKLAMARKNRGLELGPAKVDMLSTCRYVMCRVRTLAPRLLLYCSFGTPFIA